MQSSVVLGGDKLANSLPQFAPLCLRDSPGRRGKEAFLIAILAFHAGEMRASRLKDDLGWLFESAPKRLRCDLETSLTSLGQEQGTIRSGQDKQQSA